MSDLGARRAADPATAPARAEQQVTPHFLRDPLVNPVLNAEMRTWAEADLVERCRGLSVPTLIVDGALDLRPRWSVDSLAAALPDVIRYTAASSGHFPWVDQPEESAAELRRFVV